MLVRIGTQMKVKNRRIYIPLIDSDRLDDLACTKKIPGKIVMGAFAQDFKR
jgi:hypothetical protein